ncbi:hypothetical protein JCM10212_005170 [Sporobolomyces blumeae]
MEDDRPTAAHVDQEEAEEDALPDWTQFAKFAKSNGDKTDKSNAVPFIPKRGEKDFEPLPASSAFPPDSKEATLSAHQQNTLQLSRNALYSALSSGSRHHSSRAHNSFTWRPELSRATCDTGIATYGIHFGSIGHFNVLRKQIELLPEEALYMNERGAIELWKETDEGARVPMSVQQAWAELIGHDELTPERYQVYAFLKRLGYVLVRARPLPDVEKLPPKRPFSLYYTIRDALLVPLNYLRTLYSRIIESVAKVRKELWVKQIRLFVTRSVGRNEGRTASLAAGRRWATFDQIFARLQIIPTGHDRPLPRSSLPHTPSVLTPLTPAPCPSHTLPRPATSLEPERELQDLERYPYQPFFHVYKPVTKYKKSAPPPPDFRLVVVNGATTPMPTLFEFTDMFDSVPFPTENTLLPPPQPARTPTSQAPNVKVAAQRASARGRPGPPPSTSAPRPDPTRLESLLVHVPYLATLAPSLFPSRAPPSSSNKAPRKPNGPSPYPRLKTGRRTILVAIVQDGTSSILRFSEAEFAKLPWKGDRRKA